MSDADAQASGVRIYEKLTEPQRIELADFLRKKLLDSDEGGRSHRSTWNEGLRTKTTEVIDDRVRRGLPADPGYVVEEVLPAALSSVDESVRKELFLKVREMLSGGNSAALA